MATRKIYAVRFKSATYSGGEPMPEKYINRRFEELVERPTSPLNQIQVATCSLKKAKEAIQELQKLYKVSTYDDVEQAKSKGIRPTYFVTIRYYYLDVLPSI